MMLNHDIHRRPWLPRRTRRPAGPAGQTTARHQTRRRSHTAARNRERLFSDDQIREKYEITSDADWNAITQNKALRLAINAECERRMLNGDGAREAAAKQFTKAPEILGQILENERNSPKHRIDAAKELRATANVGAEKSTDDTDRVVITINLGGDEKLVVDSGPLPPKRAVQENLDVG